MAQQLYKNRAKRKILGVCAGLSDSTGIDVTLLRCVTLLGAIFTGSLIFWIYLILAIILPDKNE